MSDSVSRAVDIGNTYGFIFIGSTLGSVLYGVTIVQTWTYYSHGHSRDSMAMKGFIALLFVLDTFYESLRTYILYWYLILNFADVNNLDINMWAMEAEISVNSFVALMIQLFYARRLYLMSNSIVFPVIIVGLAVLVFGMSLMSSVREHELKWFSRNSSLTWLTSVRLGGSALVDILVALSMCWCLYHKKTGFARTNSIIMTLMIFSISSGLLTSVVTTTALISFIVAPTSLISQSFCGLLSTLHVNSLLVLMNNRSLIRDRSINVDLDSTSPNSKTRPAAISVTVDRTAIMGLPGNDQDKDMEKGCHN